MIQTRQLSVTVLSKPVREVQRQSLEIVLRRFLRSYLREGAARMRRQQWLGEWRAGLRTDLEAAIAPILGRIYAAEALAIGTDPSARPDVTDRAKAFSRQIASALSLDPDLDLAEAMADAAPVTETTRILARVAAEVWQASGKVRGYQIRSNGTCPLCWSVHRAIFPIKDTSDLPPLHRGCVCDVAPVLAREAR
ncbi:MAG: hypothetical protein ABSF61_06570 [Anaerolineales bacterium]|jgi:hypothetical protein